MPGKAGELLAAGFPEEEVANWALAERESLREKGFSDDEITAYISGNPLPPKAFVERLTTENIIPSSLLGFAKGVVTPGEKLKETLNTDSIGEVLGAVAGRVPLGMLVDQIRKGGQSTEAAVAGEPVSADEMVANATLGILGTVVPRLRLRGGELARVGATPDGQPDVVPIEGLPKVESFSRARDTITDGVPVPEAQRKLEQLWEEKGITPNEVAHDARTDVTVSQDLLADNAVLPPRYGAKAAEPPPPPPPIEPPAAGAAPEPLTPKQAHEAILDRISIGEDRTRRPMSWQRFYAATIDRLIPLEQRGAEINVADDPYKLARLYAGTAGKAEQWINHTPFEFNTYKMGGQSLKEITGKIKADELNEFRTYIAARRAEELEARGIEGGIPKEAIPIEVEAGRRFEPIFQNLITYQNSLAKYLKDAGVLSNERYEAMLEANKTYVPFRRVFGDEIGELIPEALLHVPGRTLQPTSPIYEIVGSSRRIIDPLESVVRNTYTVLAAAERNAVMQKIAEAFGGVKPTGSVGKLTYFVEGVKKEVLVDEAIATAVKGLDEESVNTIIRFMGAPARGLRAGATLTPEFQARNIVRDFSTAFINSTQGVFNPTRVARGLMSTISKDANFQKFLAGGGANAELVALDRRFLQESVADLNASTGWASRSWNVVRHPIDTLRVVSEVSERMTRVGEFRAVYSDAIARGLSEKEAIQEASFAAREITVDFARRGSLTQGLNMITAFWNAHVQGLDRFSRAMRDNPVGTTTKAVMGITVPSILLWLNNHNDPRWKEIPDWQKAAFWIVLTDNHIWRIPKPFEVGTLFGTSVERLLDAYVDSDPTAGKAFVKDMIEAFNIVPIPTFAAPLVGQLANYDTFLNRPIVPGYVESLLPEYQYTPYTTELSKKLGSLLAAFPGMRETSMAAYPLASGVARALTTPLLIENYVRAWTGGLGTYAMQAADKGLREAGVLPDPPKPEDTLADLPLVKAFTIRYPSASSKSIEEFYNRYERNDRFYRTWKAQAEAGDVEATERLQEAGGDAMFIRLERLKRTLGEHAALARSIYSNSDIPSDEKRQLIDPIYMRMQELARFGLDIMR